MRKGSPPPFRWRHSVRPTIGPPRLRNTGCPLGERRDLVRGRGLPWPTYPVVRLREPAPKLGPVTPLRLCDEPAPDGQRSPVRSIEPRPTQYIGPRGNRCASRRGRWSCDRRGAVAQAAASGGGSEGAVWFPPASMRGFGGQIRALVVWRFSAQQRPMPGRKGETGPRVAASSGAVMPG